MSDQWSVVQLPYDKPAEPDSWWETVGIPLVEALKAEIPSTEVAVQSEKNRLQWDEFLARMAALQERSRLIRIEADGQTLHCFDSVGAQWHYRAYDAQTLIDIATMIVAARDDRSLLGTIH